MQSVRVLRGLPDFRHATATAFGHASWVCNVIDTRQSYLQKLLKQALAALGYAGPAGPARPYSYERGAPAPDPSRQRRSEVAAADDRALRAGSRRSGAGRGAPSRPCLPGVGRRPPAP